MTIAHNLGFPRIGARRELKKALESFWKGDSGAGDLVHTAAELRTRHWTLQRDAGLAFVPVGDFSLYDHVLDTAVMLGAVPPRFQTGGAIGLDTYFAMARGSAREPAMEMTKWFDTNYHYIVPELHPQAGFALRSTKLVDETREALAQGFVPKPVVLGPLSFLWLGKEKGLDGAAFSRLELLDRILPVYRDVLAQLRGMGVEWVQVDEPALVMDLPVQWLAAYDRAYGALAQAGPKLLLATYFGSVEDRAELLASLPLGGVHVDLVRAPQQLDAFVRRLPGDAVLSAGVVDGRNIWRTDLRKALELIAPAAKQRDRLWVAPSCSLVHSPVDLALETALDVEVRSWLAFAVQKLDEVAVLARGLAHEGKEGIVDHLELSDTVQRSRAESPRIHNPAVAARVASLTDADERRRSSFAARQRKQRAELRLPPFPTTTIGSFPQTSAIRKARARFKRGELDERGYDAAMKAEIAHAVAEQEGLGIDVLVHGEAERNDMVEYFGEQLSGFAFTRHGWVQSYGSRYVKPPVIFGDVLRHRPMTVEWIRYAQSLTQRPMKGMLTGPVTILQWSFVRDDQPRELTATQIALAIRDEVSDLERAGIRIIQIDEPAFREGMPLRRAQWRQYIEWAARAFRIASSPVGDATQIHTHMCYSEFNEVFDTLALLDADVITIESSRSGMELLEAFKTYGYPNEIGPGVYDIHSPRVPSEGEIHALLTKAAGFLKRDQLWVNPDCGLKTRRWEEVLPALRNMVAAAARMRT